MSAIIQLDPPIPVIAKGRKSLAHALIDYGPEYDLLWVCFLDNGECWSVPNPEVRGQNNFTFGRPNEKVSKSQSASAENLANIDLLRWKYAP